MSDIMRAAMAAHEQRRLIEQAERAGRIAANAAYERGWAEGWAACLAKIQQDGLERVLEREGEVLPPNQLTLSPGGAEPGGSGA